MKVRLVRSGKFELMDDPSVAVTPPQEGFYWIDASIEDLPDLQPLFQLHELAVEDCLSEDEQRPKLELYDRHYFIVINSIRFDDEEIFLRALNIFLGGHYIITVTRQKLNEIRNVKPVLLEEQVNSPDRFLYYLIDLIVRSYFGVADRIEARIEALDEAILVNAKKSHMNEIIILRGEIMWLKKNLGPQKDLIGMLNKRELRLIDDRLQKYFSDIYEDALKIYETFETFRELIGHLREAYQLSLASRANDIMRVFTAMTVIFMPLTIITGIYGMNFEVMPELHTRYGYFAVLGVMLIVATSMAVFFRKKDWL
jgi:magnesium transporter